MMRNSTMLFLVVVPRFFFWRLNLWFSCLSNVVSDGMFFMHTVWYCYTRDDEPSSQQHREIKLKYGTKPNNRNCERKKKTMYKWHTTNETYKIHVYMKICEKYGRKNTFFAETNRTCTLYSSKNLNLWADFQWFVFTYLWCFCFPLYSSIFFSS